MALVSNISNKTINSSDRIGDDDMSNTSDQSSEVIRRDRLKSDEGSEGNGTEPNKNSDAVFEVEVNYLPKLNVVRFQKDETNDSNQQSSEESEKEEVLDDTEEESEDVNKLCTTAIIDKISKEVFDKYRKLCRGTEKKEPREKGVKKPRKPYIRSRDFKCEFCKRPFSSSASLEKHKESHANDTIYKCELCDEQFLKQKTLGIHMERNHTAGNKKYGCDQCDRRFDSNEDLNQHKMNHEEIKKYSCGECPKEFIHSGGLKRHILVHSGAKTHQCDICFKSFTQSGDLKKHLMYHRGEKPYQCEVCYKFFSQASNLNQHKKIHTGVPRTFFCNICFKMFQTNSNLQHHKLIHDRIKCFECQVCKKSFIRSGDLKKHSIIHGGEKKFQCSLCLRAFLRNGDLKKHMAVHRVEPEKPEKKPPVIKREPHWSDESNDERGLDSSFDSQFHNVELDESQRIVAEETNINHSEDYDHLAEDDRKMSESNSSNEYSQDSFKVEALESEDSSDE